MMNILIGAHWQGRPKTIDPVRGALATLSRRRPSSSTSSLQLRCQCQRGPRAWRLSLCRSDAQKRRAGSSLGRESRSSRAPLTREHRPIARQLSAARSNLCSAAKIHKHTRAHACTKPSQSRPTPPAGSVPKLNEHAAPSHCEHSSWALAASQTQLNSTRLNSTQLDRARNL